jgi:outer membrane lipoprotein
MIMNRLTRLAALLLVSGMLPLGCTSIPVQLEGEYTSLIPENATDKDIKTAVRWGGVVLETRPEEDFTCFEILSRQLSKSMRPTYSDQDGGRFIACKPGFYDPEVFEKGREVTLTGEIIYMDTRKVGEYDYRYPVIDIEFMSLWPVRRNVVYVGVYDPFRPYYWHYPPYGFRYPYW